MKQITRVLQISEPGRDGVFEYVKELIRFLNEKYPDVVVDFAYSSNRGGEGLSQLVEKVEARGGLTVDLKIGNSPQMGDFRACAKILSLIRKGRPQLIHAHSSKAGGLARLLKMFVPGVPPVIYTPHAYFGLSLEQTGKTCLFNTVETFLGHFSMTTCCSEDERSFALRKLHVPLRKVALIYNGIDQKRFRPAINEEKLAARREFGLPEDKLIICSIGGNRHQKNYPPLYQALNSIWADSNVSLHFVHAGDGTNDLVKQYITHSPEKNVTTLKYTLFPERLLQASDGFILTSRYEGFSLAVVAALSSGLKMFLTRVRGNRCLAKVGFSDIEWIESTENVEALSHRIEKSLRHWLKNPQPPSSAQAVGTREHFDAETQYEKVHHLYTGYAR